MLIRVLLAAAACLILGACGEGGAVGEAEASSGGGDAPGRMTAVATVGMVGDIVREVAGERMDVVVLMGAGVDPHLYAPTRSDVERVLGADVVFHVGLKLEGKMEDSFARAAAAGKRVVAVAEAVEEASLLASEEEEADEGYAWDPHLWMDPGLWAGAVGVVRDALIAVDADGASVYEANAAAYIAEILELDAYAERVLGSVSEGARVLVTAHDAFGYFGRRFGYEVVGIQGISTESEAGVLDIEAIVGMLVERRIGAVFVESTISERSVRALVTGAGARGHEVIVGGELFSDAMGDAGTYEGTYIGMIDHNVTTIARALGGDAPEAGLNGLLGGGSGVGSGGSAAD